MFVRGRAMSANFSSDCDIDIKSIIAYFKVFQTPKILPMSV